MLVLITPKGTFDASTSSKTIYNHFSKCTTVHQTSCPAYSAFGSTAPRIVTVPEIPSWPSRKSPEMLVLVRWGSTALLPLVARIDMTPCCSDSWKWNLFPLPVREKPESTSLNEYWIDLDSLASRMRERLSRPIPLARTRCDLSIAPSDILHFRSVPSFRFF